MRTNEGSAAASVIPGDKREGTKASYAGDLKIFVFALFFVFGGLTSLNDVLIPKLKALFTLTYGQVTLVQSAFLRGLLLVLHSLLICSTSHWLHAFGGAWACHHDLGLPVVRARLRTGNLRSVPLGAIRACRGHYHAAGGCKPTHLPARATRHGE